MQPESQTGTINPAFAGHFAKHLREATGDLHSVFDNLFEVARGDDPTANGYDRLRAVRILSDRAFGKVARRNPSQSELDTDTPIHHYHDHVDDAQDHSEPVEGACPEPVEGPKAAETSNRPVARLEQKLDDALGSPQTPAKPEGGEPVPSEKKRGPMGLPAPSIDTPNYTPDLVRDSQYYVLEITSYGAELASILAYINQPDPDDTSIKACHRVTAGRMIIERTIGLVPDHEQPLDHWHDPSWDPRWVFQHPADVDSDATPEELMKAERAARNVLHGFLEEADACENCTDGARCENHHIDYDELIMVARSNRNLAITIDRLYYSHDDGRFRLQPPDHIDDS